MQLKNWKALTKQNIKRNFGSPNPEGYRKSLRLMKQAEKFKRPIICFINTSGAYCGVGAEERGQGEAIAKNLMDAGMDNEFIAKATSLSVEKIKTLRK